MTSVVLRPYQEDLIESLRERMRRRIKRVLTVLPTGGGKTVCFSYMSSRAADSGARVYIGVHRDFLLRQTSKALTSFGVRHGIIAPGHVPTPHKVQVISIPTWYRRLKKLPHPDLIIIDEAHHCAAKTWAGVVNYYPEAHLVGFTATPERTDGRGLNQFFHDLVEGPNVDELMDMGFLSRFRLLTPPTKIDLSGISKRGGDYAKNELAEATNTRVITGDAVMHYANQLSGRPAIAFCVTVQHAEDVAAAFREQGWRAASIDGTMNDAQREERLGGLANGGLNILTSCELINEGMDVPEVYGAILLRPTASLSVYLQQVGRTLRPKADGSPAVILDHVGNSETFGPPNLQRAWSLDGREKAAREVDVKQCSTCYRSFPANVKLRDCPEGEKPTNCPMHKAYNEGGGRDAPDVIDGELVEVKITTEWSDDLCIKTAPLKKLVKKATTRQQLEEIQQARGYKPTWVDKMLDVKAAYAERKRDEYHQNRAGAAE